ncbi:uncharacterized protein LOC110973572 [Acanthaster planci]|uniref:Uncharacterized protein LOC110973572 n=1 Tax=Acanthaster planci TaxID=133434 RepID=A0A8B7XH96_ACAPL|nr:uncharacterized protein LOC110973572 [Acanthaster planci]
MDMTVRGFLFIFCFLPASFELARSQSTDDTMQPGAEGTYVVISTLRRLSQLTEDSSGDLQPDHGFLRRVAWVDTRDGTAAGAYDPNYHGGIWRVDRSVYDATQAMLEDSRYSSIFGRIRQLFDINWDQTTWQDCRKPIYSALAARLYFHRLQSTIPKRLSDQATLWWNEYHTRPTDTVENFIRKVSALEGTYATVCALNMAKTRDRGTDLTVVAEASGTAVVEATLQKINRLMTEQDGSGSQPGQTGLQADFNFMRRLAWVETLDGTAEFTYSDPAYHGGIWRVDRGPLQATLEMTNVPEYRAIFRTIEQIFCIDWKETSWEDCRKPLYSALAARLYFHNQKPAIPQGVSDQAEYLGMQDQSRPNKTVTNFVMNVTNLDSESECLVRGIDLVFVMDSSGSVTSSNFELMKNFVLEVVDFFDIGPDRTRVSVIRYASDASIQFSLNKYTDKTLLKQAIQRIEYSGGGTQTVTALNLMESQSFLEGNGARPANQGLPRVAVVITDGQSQGPQAVAIPADRAREKGITLFAIGVTSSVNDDELNAIANKPSETYVFHVDNFQAIANIGVTLQGTTCNQATPITEPIINGTLDGEATQYLQQAVPAEGVTLAIEASNGSVAMYVSITTPNPNEALHDFLLVAVAGAGSVEVFLGPENFDGPVTVAAGGGSAGGTSRKRRDVPNSNQTLAGSPIGTVYMTIQGRLAENKFVLVVDRGDVTEPSTTKPATDVGVATATTVAYRLLLALTIVTAALVPTLLSC